MIWQLAAQHARHNRRYVGWAAAMLALFVAASSLAAFQHNTGLKSLEQSNLLAGFVHARNGFIDVRLPSADPIASYEGTQLSGEEVNVLVSAALANDPRVVATRFAVPLIASTEEQLVVVATRGDHRLDVFGVSEAPTPGTTYLNGAVMAELGVKVGDTITLVAPATHLDDDYNIRHATTTANPGTELMVTIVGELATVTSWPKWGLAPQAVLSWEDSFGETSVFTLRWSQSETTQGGLQTAFVHISWEGGNPELDGLLVDNGILPHSEAAGSHTSRVALMVAIAMLAAVILMAFAMGRAQAQRRLQWVATARTLGASASTMRSLAGLEALILAGIALVGGVALAALGNVATVAISNATTPGGIAPYGIGTSAALWSLIVVGVISVAIVIAAVPAFWSGREGPVAALKPVNDISESEVSRRVSVWWLTIPLALGSAVFASGSAWGAQDSDVRTFGAAITAVPAYFLLLEATRVATAALGRALSRMRVPAAISAGAAIEARPRQFATPAFISAGAVITAAIFGATNFARPTFWAVVVEPTIDWDFGEFVYAVRMDVPWVVTLTIITLGVAQLVAVAIGANSARISALEDATQRALGLNDRSRRYSAFIKQVVPQLVGVGFGAVASVGVAAVDPLRRWENDGLDLSSASFVDSLTAIGIIAGIGLVVVAVVGLVVMASHRALEPLVDAAAAAR